jgi:hypothetical protein
MQNLSRNYILLGLVWLICGMVFGAWLGASGHPNYANSHAHMNLLGFVASVLFGLLYWAYPSLATSRLAVPQFITYQLGTLLLVIGKILVDGGTDTLFLQIGAIISIIGAALMLMIFAQDGARARA